MLWIVRRRESQQHASTSGRTTARDYRPSGGPPVTGTRKGEASQSPARIKGVDDGRALDEHDMHKEQEGCAAGAAVHARVEIMAEAARAAGVQAQA